MNQAPLPPLASIPADLVSVADYERYAQARVEAGAWAYLNGAAADGFSAQANLDAFKNTRLNTRVLNDLSQANTRLNLFGHQFDHPFFLAPVAYHQLAHPEGELATVLGAGATGTGMVLSTQASTDLALLARQAHAPLWFQLYLQSRRETTQGLVSRAYDAGYKALVVTVDAPVSGIRNHEQRTGFRLPPHIRAVNLPNEPEAATQPHPNAGNGPLFGSGLLTHAATWQDVEWLLSWAPLPVLLKGILNASDAKHAQELGCAGVVVSNHGGRTLDGVPATLDALPAIKAAVGPQFTVMLDGGIRRGSDAFKALALGAHAVLLGRPAIWGLAVAGATGVAHIIQILRAELETTMALTGCANLAAINRAALVVPEQ